MPVRLGYCNCNTVLQLAFMKLYSKMDNQKGKQQFTITAVKEIHLYILFVVRILETVYKLGRRQGVLEATAAMAESDDGGNFSDISEEEDD